MSIMNGHEHFTTMILVLGVLIIVTLLIKSGFRKAGLPSLAGFLLLGLLLKTLDGSLNLINDHTILVLEFLGKIGLVMLLFRVGLESQLKKLMSRIGSAGIIWVADVTVSGTLGFLSAYYFIGLSAVTSLIVATAFTATSVGITVAVWREMGALQTREGEVLVDVAELDDISAVVLMALLFAILPELKNGFHFSLDLWSQIGKQAGIFALKLMAFGGFCLLFSNYVEKQVTAWFKGLETPPDPMLSITGIGLIIAALAALLGFSLAIGAFFAGLMFSRDPEAVKMESSFIPLYDFFSPFFFIGIGLNMDAGSLSSALGMGSILAVAAAAGKLLADGLPVFLMYGWTPAVLIGTSMIPRAEIALIIMQNSKRLGAWAMPSTVYNAMVVVCFATCVLAPAAVRILLKNQSRE